MKQYDPALAMLLTEIFGDTDWRYTHVVTRTHLSHLQGFNPEQSPKFKWSPELMELTEFHQELRNPDSDGDGRWVNLDEQALSSLPNLKSGDDTTKTAIVFMNRIEYDLRRNRSE